MALLVVRRLLLEDFYILHPPGLYENLGKSWDLYQTSTGAGSMLQVFFCIKYFLINDTSGEIIATSHDLGPQNGAFGFRDIPRLFQGNLGW